MEPAAAKAPSPTPSPVSQEPKRYGDDSIPEEDLEFNADGTDLNKVFVQPPPSPQFAAATGTFKTLKLEAESAARAAEEMARTGEREAPAHEPFDPVDTQVDVEIDPDLLATMAQLSGNRQDRLSPAPPPPEPDKPTPPKPTRVLQPPMEPPPQQQVPMRLAERAKARADAAREEAARAEAARAEAARAEAARAEAARAEAARAEAARAEAERAEAARAEVARAETSRSAVEQSRVGDVARTGERAFNADAAAAAATASALETTEAIRAALAPRRRSSAQDSSQSQSEQPTSLPAGLWTAGSAVLLLILVLQIVHHYRHDLAANSTLNGPLTSIYAALGIPLVPRWDLAAYEVRQLGASTAADSPGQITVRASVKNGAHQAQPLPLLRVTLQDRFGNRIASRDVPPQSYLPRAIPSSSRLSAGQRIDAEMAFVDPGANAVGFEIDACLPAPGGGISCTNDSARQ